MAETGASMHIGEVAERTGLSHRTIRHYDEVGLVVPSGRSDGGFRLYTEADVDRLLLIRRMKPLDYRLEEMKALLETVDAVRADASDAEARARLSGFAEDVAARRAALQRQLDMADEFTRLLAAL